MRFVPLTIKRDTAIIHLTLGKYAMIDLDDWELVFGAGKWQAHQTGRYGFYANSKRGFMHNFLMKAVVRSVDHVNRNKLDNRRGNLRLASMTLNMANRVRRNKCGYRGIHRQTNGRFQALIKGNGLGTFSTREQAARAFDVAAKAAYGEFAILNFPN